MSNNIYDLEAAQGKKKGSRTALSSSSIGRASPGRHGRPKRRRLDVTTPTSPGRRRAGGGGGGEQQTDDHHDDDAGAVRGVEGASSASSATCWPHHNGRDERARVRPAPPWPREPCWPGSHGDEESWWPLGVPVGLPAAWGSDAPTPVASGQPQPTPSTVVPSGQPQPTAPSTAEVTTAPPTAASTVGNVGCWTLTASEESAQHGQQAQHEQYGQLGQHGQLGQLELYGQHGQLGQHGQQGQLGQNGQQTQLSQLGQHGRQGQHEQYGQQGQLGQRGLQTQLGQLGQHGQQGQQGEDSDGSYSSQDSAGDQRSRVFERARRVAGGEPGWSQLPAELLVGVFRLLRLRDLGRVAQVCRAWRRASQEPCLWRTAEFALGSSLRPEPTPPALVNFILERHAQHLRFVVLRTDSSAESTRGACRILARLVKCSLRTLALMSGARALDPDEQRLVSALTLVLGHSSPSLRALAVDHTLVDDPSLQALGSSSAASLQLLRCKGCPRLSPGGVLALVDHCRCLRELSLSYTLLSDDLLNALSSERHVCLES
ncbi:F-box/LRR-repeat protein 21 [Frankliniella fusca]|uniref:F-box/LRR-repeat protein 21 n=1 Tax=Frankliniella fusca TaxID=407009 RepID=A0AAE1HFS3_9NEOP|nr:F-box/LRR-repeat protein 21 [Frankliniella fusca]